MKTRSIALILASALTSLSLLSCETAGQGAKKGAMYGAAAGVAKGILDDKEGNVLKSGVIGAGIGAGAGAAVGASKNKNNNPY